MQLLSSTGIDKPHLPSHQDLYREVGECSSHRHQPGPKDLDSSENRIRATVMVRAVGWFVGLSVCRLSPENRIRATVVVSCEGG